MPTQGTEYFKADEVDTRFYAFMPDPGTESSGLRHTLFREEHLNLTLDGPSESLETPVVLPVRYNPLHDFESLWWLAVYFVLKREVRETAANVSEAQTTAKWDRDEQRTHADIVFGGKDFKCKIITIPNSFYNDVLRVVHPKMRPVIGILEGLRLSLIQRYTEVEKDAASIPWTRGAGIYEKFIRGCAEIADRLELRHVRLPPIFASPGPVVRMPNVAAERRTVAELEAKAQA